MKVCSACNEPKVTAEFYSGKGKCKPCERARQKEWRAANPSYKYLHRYGVTKDLWDEMFEKQGGFCRICGGVNDNGRALSVDHDHDTGEVRGLLCGHCNTGLGMFRDDTNLLLSAVIYLSP